MAIVVPVISTFDAKGITKAISNFQKLEGGAAKTGFVLRAVDQGVTSLITGLAKAGAAIGVVGGIIGTKLVGAAYESQKVMAQTEAILLSTQSTAGHTADSIAALSERMSEKIGIDDEVIQKSANLLLTFKQVRNGVGEQNAIFDRAIQASADLGNVFGSIEGAAMQMGKALADPVTGMNALRRSGVNFTESQRETIKALVETGDLLGAQKIILQEVESQVGGTAEATATDFDRMKVAVGNTAEALGAVLIPYVERFARFVKDEVVPYIKELIKLFQEEGLGGVIRQISGDFLNFLGNLGKTGNVIYGLVTAIAMLKAAVIAYNVATTVATAITKIFNITLAANPIGLIAAAIAALIVLIVAMYLKFDWFRAGVNAIINGVISYFEFMANAWIFAINIVIKGVNAVRGILAKFGIDLPKVAELGEVSFGRVGVAASKATGKIKDMSEAIMKAKNAERMAMEAANKPADTGLGGGGGGESPLERAKRQLKEYTDALKNVKDAQISMQNSNKALAESQKAVRDAVASTKNAQQNLTLATQKVADAQANFNNITQGFARDSKQAKDALAQVAESGKRLRDANFAQTDAVRNLRDAEKKLADLRALTADPQKVADAERKLRDVKLQQKDAVLSLTQAEKRLADLRNRAADPNNVAEAERRLERSKYAVEEANFRVADMEAKLLKLREDPKASPVELRRAEIDLAEAKLSVVDSVNNVSEAEAKLDEQRNVAASAEEIASAERDVEKARFGVQDATIAITNAETELNAERNRAATAEEIVEGERAVEEAKYKVQDAIDAVTEATKDLTDAQEAEKEVLFGAVVGSLAYERALELLDDAKAEQKKASDAVEEAIDKERDAVDKLKKAQDDLRDSTWAVFDAEKALRELRSQIPVAIRQEARADFAAREAGFAPGASIPSLPDFVPTAMAMNASDAAQGTINNIVINSQSLNPAESAEYIVDALRAYERSNGFIPVRVDSAVYAV